MGLFAGHPYYFLADITYSEISTVIESVTKTMQEIATGSTGQASGIEEYSF